jgi:putative transposase
LAGPLIAYCLMPNHYHWFVRQDGLMPVRLLAQKVWKSYANSFNHSHGRHGALFENRFQDLPVDEDDYRRTLCCYIHRNPVAANLAAAPGLWPYSNYLDCIGQRPGTLVDHAFIDTYFGGAAAYQRLIEAPAG